MREQRTWATFELMSTSALSRSLYFSLEKQIQPSVSPCSELQRCRESGWSMGREAHPEIPLVARAFGAGMRPWPLQVWPETAQPWFRELKGTLKVASSSRWKAPTL